MAVLYFLETWEGKDIGKHLKKIMKLSIELIGDNDKDNVMIIKITNNEKDRGGRGEDVGGRLDIGEQLIPLFSLFFSFLYFILSIIIFCYCAPPMIALALPQSSMPILLSTYLTSTHTRTS